jgi:hypothetical protein
LRSHSPVGVAQLWIVRQQGHMINFGAIALGLFWIAAIKLWFTDGPKIPLICIALWFVVLLSVPLFHLPFIVFSVVTCLLGVFLFLVDRYKSALL